MDPIEPALFYTGLVAEAYASLRSVEPDPEVYARFIAHTGEPALELGCGDGDPLLALRERGLDVEGLDSSPDMLDRCHAAAAARGIDVVLHLQPMQSMQLERRYRTIFVAGPSFNLLPDDETTQVALARVREHLTPDGIALIPLFIPPAVPQAELGRARESTAADGTVVRFTALAEHRDEDARMQITTTRYERVTSEETVVVERPWIIHWHTKEGFEELATSAGLVVKSVRDVGPDAFAFQLVR